MPVNLYERVQAGALSLRNVPRKRLLAWAREATRQCDKDLLGDAIIYGVA